MLKILKHRNCFLMGLLVACLIQGSIALGDSSGRLISEELLKHANLKVLWENELPIKDIEKVRQVLTDDIPHGRVVDEVVAVYQDVPEGYDAGAVADPRSGVGVVPRDTAHGLANDLEVPLDGRPQDGVRPVVL